MDIKKTLKWSLIFIIIINVFLFSKKRIYPRVQNFFLAKKYEKQLIEEKKSYTDEVISNTEVKNNEFVYNEYEVLEASDEAARMKAYVGDYFNYIKNEEYDKAYELLYENFKKNYFNSLDEFIDYVKNTYPEEFYLKYGDIKRYGYYYYVSVNIFDLDEITSEEKEYMKGTVFVLKENDILDYVLSFGL